MIKFFKKIIQWFKRLRMTQLENYSQIIDGIFGVGTTTFDKTQPVKNLVIGALNRSNEFHEFRINFVARLERLKRIYSAHPAYLVKLLVQVNEVASEKNWQGAFAELAAFDHLNQDILNHQTYIHTPIKPDITIPNTRTFGAQLGKSAANLDAFVEDRPVYLDFKVFKDNVKEILESQYEKLAVHFKRKDFAISAEYDLSMHVDEISSKIGPLLNELKNDIVPLKTTVLKSKVIPSLTFRIQWGRGILITERTHGAYEHAETHHKMVFKNADQFVKDTPSMLVYVVFPWYNGIISNFTDMNTQLYRSFARRVFCQYRHDPTTFKSIAPSFTGSETIYQISNYISGIVFLEDYTIQSDKHNETNVKSYVYLNPNAVNSLSRSLSSDFLRGLHNIVYDDFENDNY